MQFHQMTHDRQTKSHPPLFSSHGTVFLAEAIEDVGQKVRRNAYTRVADLNLSVVTRAIESKLYPSSRWCKLQCIREQIPNDLPQAV